MNTKYDPILLKNPHDSTLMAWRLYMRSADPETGLVGGKDLPRYFFDLRKKNGYPDRSITLAIASHCYSATGFQGGPGSKSNWMQFVNSINCCWSLLEASMHFW